LKGYSRVDWQNKHGFRVPRGTILSTLFLLSNARAKGKRPVPVHTATGQAGSGIFFLLT